MSGERTEKITPIGELMRDRLAELRQRWEQLEKDPAMKAALRARDLEVGRVLADAGVEAAVRAFGASERPTRGTPLFRKARQIAALSQYDEDGWRQLHRAPFLAVDDLGTEALDAKDWGAAGIRDLIDRRYDDERRTILTMNLSVETFRARYAQDGGRLFRRFREAAKWIEIAAPAPG